MSIQHTLKQGDKVAYYIKRRVNAVDSEAHGIRDGYCQIRRVGIVKGWHDGKVIVLHKAGYTEMVADADLYLVE